MTDEENAAIAELVARMTPLSEDQWLVIRALLGPKSRRDDPMPCPLCSRPMPNRASLSKHLRRKHKITSEEVDRDYREQIYFCQFCDEPGFDTRHRISAHVTNHHRGQR